MPEEIRKNAALIVGVLGGTASGKSTVARIFGEFGAEVIDADAMAQAVLDENDAKAEVRKTFGAAILGGDGQVDRAALSRVVFDDPQRLEALTRIVHPRVTDRIRSRIAESSGERVIVLDIPLLAESPLIDECQLLVFVEARLDLRERRARESRGWQEGEVARREGHQAPLNEKKQRAHFVVQNEGSIEEARREAGRIWKEIVESKEVKDA